MPCYIIKTPSIPKMFICGENLDLPYCADHGCHDIGENLCDYPVGDGKTCDKPLCETHATEIGPDLHYCPAHTQMWVEWKKAGGENRALENVVSFAAAKADPRDPSTGGDA